MTVRRNYAEDPTLGDQVFALLESVFPGVGSGRGNGAQFGVPWESISTPFVVGDNGAVVAHVGLLSLPLFVMGRRTVVGAVDAVATDPAHRGRGLFRSLLHELIMFAEAHYPTLLLTTVHPEYFTPFGFRVVAESIFRAPAPRVAPSGARDLDLRDPRDIALMKDRLRRRVPLSPVLGAADDAGVWAFYEFKSRIRYDGALHVAVIAERVDRTLKVFDVVAPVLPTLEDVVRIAGEPVDEVVVLHRPGTVPRRRSAADAPPPDAILTASRSGRYVLRYLIRPWANPKHCPDI